MLARVCDLVYASIDVKSEVGGGGGPRAYVGHLTFRKNFGQNHHRGAPKFGQIRSNILHLPTLDFPYNPIKERCSINLY